MKLQTLLLGLSLTAASSLVVISCGKSDTPAGGPMPTTRQITIATLPAPDPMEALTDTRPATRPEDGKSKPVGEIKKVTLPDGLIIEDIRLGKGDEVPRVGRVWVHYTGWLDNNTIFDDSRPGGIPRGFPLGNGESIKGWDEGVPGMRVGGIRLLTIPPALGYGADKKGDIPPNSTLHFRIQVDHIDK